MSKKRFSDDIELEDDFENAEDFKLENEQTSSITDIKLPSNPNTWLFVVVIIGITSIFSVLTVLQNDRVEDAQTSLAYWKQLHAKQERKIDSLHHKLESTDNCVEKINKLKSVVDDIKSNSTKSAKEKRQELTEAINDL